MSLLIKVSLKSKEQIPGDHALETVLGDKPSDHMYGCDLDYQGNLTVLQEPPCATSTDKDTSRTQNYREESVWKDKERATVCCQHMENHSLCGGSSCFCFSIAHRHISFAPKQMKLIHNHLCFQNGQINIPEIYLTWFYTVTMKCPLNSFEQYICTHLMFVNARGNKKYVFSLQEAGDNGTLIHTFIRCRDISLRSEKNNQKLNANFAVEGKS